MRERPILFSAPMVRALIADTKTQTRRPVKPQPDWLPEVSSTRRTDGIFWPIGSLGQQCGAPIVACPYGVPGDRLWVREAWRTLHKWDTLAPRNLADDISKITYEADPENRNPLWAFGKLRPSMFMPRWASRLTLEITEVRVERLNACSEADARAEGCVDGGCLTCGESSHPEPCGCATPAPSYVDSYAHLWETINGAGSWATNPWIWAVSFKRVEA